MHLITEEAALPSFSIVDCHTTSELYVLLRSLGEQIDDWEESSIAKAILCNNMASKDGNYLVSYRPWVTTWLVMKIGHRIHTKPQAL